MITTPNRAELVTFRPAGARRSRTVYLADPRVISTSELGELLSGIEVDQEGTPIAGRGFDERRHLIALGAISRRIPVRMSMIYGEYEEIPGAPR